MNAVVSSDREPAFCGRPVTRICRVLGAVHLRSARVFTYPTTVPPDAAGPEGPVSPEERTRLETALRDRLYATAFARPFPAEVSGAVEAPGAVPNGSSEGQLGRSLRAANRGQERWQTGWTLVSVHDDGSVSASREGLTRAVRPGDYALTFTEELAPAPGRAATVRLAVDSFTLQSGVYTAFGETLPRPEDRAPALRLYLAAPTAAWPDLYAFLTGELNRRRVPFTLKSMLLPHERRRLDGTVLYLPARYLELSRRLPEELPAPLRQALGPSVPLFTEELAPGIGWARSPGNGESFGRHRCRLVAEGLVDAWLDGDQDIAGRRRAVAERFRSAGLDWTSPHLGPADDKAVPPAPSRPSAASAADQAIAACIERGWLPAETRWRATDRSRRNQNWVIRDKSRDDPPSPEGFFLKRLRVSGEESRSMLEREATIYGLARDHLAFSALRELLPPFHGFHRKSGDLLLGLVGNGENLGDRQRRGEIPPAASAAAFGRALARLHGEVRLPPNFDPDRRLLPRRVPGIFTAHRGGPLLRWLGPAQRELVLRIGEHSVLAPALDRLAETWSFDRLTHGDVKWENALLEGERIFLVDWELADRGDAAWDVGSGLQTWLAEEVRRPAWQGPFQGASAAFLDAYREKADADDDLLRRSLACAGARLLQTALEEQHRLPPNATSTTDSLPRRLLVRAIEVLESANTDLL